MDKLRIGLVGTGFIAPFHFQGFKPHPDAEVVGMSTHANLDKLRAMCADWRIKPYDSFDAMVADPAIDALVIGSVNTDHLPQIMKAIAHKKHLLVEKPMLTTTRDLDLVEAAARQAGLVLFPGHNFAYRGAFVQAKEIVASGALGRITWSGFMSTHTISAEHATGWRATRSMGFGGALMDSGHHQVYQALCLLGVPARLQAFSSRLVLVNMDCEDIAQVNLQYPDGSLGCIMQSWTSGHGEGINGIRILGDKGELALTDALKLNGKVLNADTDYGNSFVNQARAFIDCVRQGTPPVSTVQDARDTLSLILKAYRSADQATVINWRD